MSRIRISVDITDESQNYINELMQLRIFDNKSQLMRYALKFYYDSVWRMQFE